MGLDVTLARQAGIDELDRAARYAELARQAPARSKARAGAEAAFEDRRLEPRIDLAVQRVTAPTLQANIS
jgi:hypothetical protein